MKIPGNRKLMESVLKPLIETAVEMAAALEDLRTVHEQWSQQVPATPENIELSAAKAVYCAPPRRRTMSNRKRISLKRLTAIQTRNIISDMQKRREVANASPQTGSDQTRSKASDQQADIDAGEG